MTSTTTAELIDSGILEIGDGYRARNSELATTGIPFARAQNLNSGFDFSDADLFPEEALPKVGPKLSRPGDCVFTSKGSVGRIGYVDATTPRFVYSPQLSYWRSLDWDVLHPLYLRYWLLGPEFTRQRDSVKGATDMADYVNLRDQRRMTMTLPPITTQRKVAAILSTYDDLIDNDSRRIMLLEELAQRIYREWFVDFRYPAHETIARVDSELGAIPEGWVTASLDELCTEITDGAHSSPVTMPEGFPMASVKDMARWTLDIGGCRLIAREAFEVLRRQGCQPQRGDVLISKDGAKCLDKVIPIVDDPSVVLLSSIAILRPSPLIPQSLLTMILRSPDTKSRLLRRVSGAAIPRVVLKDFKTFRICLPPAGLRASFAQHVDSLVRLSVNLEETIRTLARARDSLLPRLVSGEIDVSRLAIEPPGSAA